MNNGWVKIHRDIRDHWIWQDPEKFKCWIDILVTVNFEDKKVLIGSQLFECKRGQSLLSIQTWAQRWRVSKSAAYNLLNILKSDNMITLENLGKSTRLTVCKYEDYQDLANDRKTQEKRTENDRQSQLKKDKNEKKEKKRSNKTIVGLQATPTPQAAISDRCLAFVNYFNGQKNSKYQATKKVRQKFNAAIKVYSSADLKNVIESALNDPHHKEHDLMYVTPEFVLRTEIIERYKNIQKAKRVVNI